MAVSFTPTYFNKRQYLYDTALSSDKFNSDKFNELDTIDPQQADMFAELSIGAKDKQSNTFNVIDYNRLSAEDSMLYLYNEFYVDKEETATDEETGETYNVYDRNNEYLQYKIQEAIDQEIFNSLNGWEKFWATVGTALASAATEVYGVLEGLIDGVTLLLGGAADLLTAGQFHEEISEGTKKALSYDVTGVGYLRDEINDITRKYTYIDKSTGWKVFNDVVVGITQMAPLALNAIAPGVGTGIYYGSMSGRTAEEKAITNPDIDLWALISYTAASVGVEALVENLSGKVFGAPTGIDNLISGGSSVVRKGGFLRRIVTDMATEGLEESVSEFADSVLNIAFIDHNAPLASFQDILYAGLIGGLIGGIATGGSIATTRKAFVTKEGDITTYKIAKEAKLEGVKLTKMQTIDLKTALSEATRTMRQSAVSDLYAKYSSEDVETIQTKHAEEYQKAVEADTKRQQSILDTTMALSKILEKAGAEGFAKATELAQYTIDQQSKFIRRFTEYSPSDNAKLAVVEAKINKANPNSTATITEDLNATQLKIRDAFKKMGIDLYFAQYGEADGQIKQHETVLDEKTVVMDADLFKNASYDYILDKVAKRSLVKTLQTQSGVLNKNALSRLKMLLFSTKAYDYGVMDDVKYLNETQIERLTDAELKRYADKQADVLAQTLLFDELTVRKVFLGDSATFKGVYKWLDKTKAFLEKFARKDNLNKVKYNSVLKSIRLYEDVIADTSLNEQYAIDAAKDLGMDDEVIERIVEKFDSTKHDEDFKHWAYIPANKTSKQTEYINCKEELHNRTKGKFTFRDAFNPEIYDDVFRQEIEKSMDRNETFKHALQRYLINKYEHVIDSVHENLVEVTIFRNHIADEFDDAMSSLADRSWSIDDFRRNFKTVGDVYNTDFNNKVYDDKTSTNLYNIPIVVEPVNRATTDKPRGSYNPNTKVMTLYVDLTLQNREDFNVELLEFEHTIYHETQHIIAEWTNMFSGGSVNMMVRGLKGPNNENMVKALWEQSTNISWQQGVAEYGLDDVYRMVGEFVYSNLAGELLADSKISRKAIDITSVFGTNDYFELEIDSDTIFTVRGRGVFEGRLFQINYNIPPTIVSERTRTTRPLETLRGDTTSALKDISKKRYFINDVKNLINDTDYSEKGKKYISGVGDTQATNDAIALVYPKNKYATNIEYVDQAANLGMIYSIIYRDYAKSTTKGEELDVEQSHTFEEIEAFVNDLRVKLPIIDDVIAKIQDKKMIDVDRKTLLNKDFDYSINKINETLRDVKFNESITKSKIVSTSTTIKGIEGVKTLADIIPGETEEATIESVERGIAQKELGFEDAALANVITKQMDEIQNNIDLPETFTQITAIMDYAREIGGSDGRKILELFKERNWLTKELYTKRINKLVDALNVLPNLTTTEQQILNTDVSAFESPLDFIEHIDALRNIQKTHKEDVSRETKIEPVSAPVVEKPVSVEKKIEKQKPVVKERKKSIVKTQETEQLIQATPSENIDVKQPSSVAQSILNNFKQATQGISEAQFFDTQDKSYTEVGYAMIEENAALFTTITDENYDEIRNEIKSDKNFYSDQALLIFDLYTLEMKGKFSQEIQNKIEAFNRRELTKSAQRLALQAKRVANRKPITNTLRQFAHEGWTAKITDEQLQELDKKLKDKDAYIAELSDKIAELEEQIKTTANELERQALLREVKEVSDQKLTIQHGTNEDIADWLVTHADTVESAMRMQEKLLNKALEAAERAEAENKELGYFFYNKDGTPKPFPKTREFIFKALKKLRSFRMWSLLSSPVTWFRNKIGNVGMTVLDNITNSIERTISSRVDFGATQLKFNETKAGKAVYDHISKTNEGFIKSLARGEGSKYDPTGAQAADIKRQLRAKEYESANTFQKLCLKAQDLTDWGLSTGPFGDEPAVMNAIAKNMGNLVASNPEFLLQGIRNELTAIQNKKTLSESQQTRKKILEKAVSTKDAKDIFDALSKEETTRLFDQAKQMAFQQYFKNQNVFSKWVGNLSTKNPIAAEFVTAISVFPKGAANILAMAYRYSPLGFVSGLMQWSQARQVTAEGYKGPSTGFEQAKAIRSFSEASVGTVMLIAGAIAAALGWVDIDDDDYLGPCLKFGDIRISLSELAPSMTTFSTAAAMIWAWKNNKSAVSEALNVLYDNTLLGNIENLFRYSSLESFGQNLSISYLSQYIPAVVKLVNKAILKTPTKDKSGPYLTKLAKTLGSYIPGIALLVPDKIDPYTGKKVYASGSENWFINFIAGVSPLGLKINKQSDLEIEAEHLGVETTGFSGTFVINGKQRSVSNTTKETLAKYRANYIQTEYSKILNGQQLVTIEDKNGKRITTKYSKLTNEQKANVLKNLYSKATDITKIKYWIDSGNAYYTSNKDEYNRLRKTITSGIYYNAGWSKSKFVER